MEELVAPNVKEIETTYVERLESRSEKDSSDVTLGEIVSDVTYGIITGSEVREVVKATKRDTEGGPGMIRLLDLKKVGHEHLASIFNKWWADGIPMEEKSSRTILLHKGGDKIDVGNWRLIPKVWIHV